MSTAHCNSSSCTVSRVKRTCVRRLHSALLQRALVASRCNPLSAAFHSTRLRSAPFFCVPPSPSPSPCRVASRRLSSRRVARPASSHEENREREAEAELLRSAPLCSSAAPHTRDADETRSEGDETRREGDVKEKRRDVKERREEERRAD